MIEMSTPLVSIACITYNHKPYIRQCLEGFVMQQTNFDFEIVIHDDASTDGTKDIIIEYSTKYPHLFRPIFQKVNRFKEGRGICARFVFPECRGKYIALCEGDDYWTDPLKLQKLVDILENDSFVGCVYTRYLTVDVASNVCEFLPAEHHQRRSFTGDIFSALMYGNFPQTLTVLFRKDLLDFSFAPPSEIDYSLFLKLAIQKDFYFLQDVTGAYRINPNGLIQSGEFFKNDTQGLLMYYYCQYLKHPHFKRTIKNDLKIHWAFLRNLCYVSNFRNNSRCFQEVIRNFPFIIVPIVLFCLLNGITAKLRKYIRILWLD